MAMSKLVFYIETGSHLVGAQKILIDLAAHIADNSDNEVYYVNNYYSEDMSRHSETRLRFSTLDDFDYSNSNETIFFTPVNYAMHLLTRIKDYPDAKICHYVYDIQATNWLISHIGNWGCSNTIRQLLEESKACAYLNYKCVYPQDKYNNYPEKIFLPLSLSYPINKIQEFDDVVNKDEINIAFYGNLNNVAVNVLQNLFYNMALMRLDTPVNLHIIGTANAIPSLDFKTCTSGLAKIIFTGKLTLDDATDYVRKNVDVILAYGEYAVECSDFGVPVVIPVTSEKKYIGNNYVYLFNANGYVYSWSNESLLSLNNTCYKIDKILTDIYTEGKKAELARQCYNYSLNHVSMEADIKKYMNLIEESSLYVKDYLCIDEIVNTLNDFDGMKKDNKNIDFGYYLKNRKK